jgi:phage tail sheath protein FI
MPTYLSPGVYVEEVDGGSKPIAGVGTSVAAFVGFTKKGPMNTPTLVTNWTQFVDNFGDFMENGFLAHSVYGYYNNGGGRAYIMRIGGPDEADENEAQPLPAVELPSRLPNADDTIRITAIEADGDEITVEIANPDPTEPGSAEPQVEGGSVEGETEPQSDSAAVPDTFKLVVRRGSTEESFDNLSLRRGGDVRNVETIVNDEVSGSKLINVAMLRTSGPMRDRIPVVGSYPLSVTEIMPLAQNIEVTPSEFEGSAPDRTGMGALEVPDDITMLVCPDLMMAYQSGVLDLEGVQAVQTAMITHCERMGDRVAVLDAPPGMNPQEVQNWRVNIANYDSSYAALYYPWIKVSDPASGQNILVPPSGHMAGIWSRTDNTRGVHKAPANEVIGGALDVELQITRGEQDGLNPVGVNCIRSFPGRGIRVWGARTLSSDPSWTYLNVRRLFNMVEKSIDNGTQWVVFEPNDFALWQKISRAATAFLTMVWRQGALFGATPSEAFYVKCDAETNPPEARDLGMVTTEIGIAPVKPAEFVIFRISQWSPDV